ncbi:twin transmembrane helix small protein [Methylobacter sp. S3L5C]|uniref:twin transmembrane helix small protein n=1 Tax=Methylobacter sp. S3L5C TaxID=2839024 RepID=UPI001FAC2AF8|nr:twin transmembrane helix small protein [Methylobacter sp. S3L5C]UOA08517.1 twin transmembrane helix small protein [Methylobacter sp. S3L5C]
MIIKSVVIIAFILIIISLGSALFHLVSHKNQESSEKTVKALTFRITLSILLFAFIFIALITGAYKPQGLGMQMHMKKPVQTDAIK